MCFVFNEITKHTHTPSNKRIYIFRFVMQDILFFTLTLFNWFPLAVNQFASVLTASGMNQNIQISINANEKPRLSNMRRNEKKNCWKIFTMSTELTEQRLLVFHFHCSHRQTLVRLTITQWNYFLFHVSVFWKTVQEKTKNKCHEKLDSKYFSTWLLKQTLKKENIINEQTSKNALNQTNKKKKKNEKQTITNRPEKNISPWPKWEKNYRAFCEQERIVVGVCVGWFSESIS